MSASYGPEYLLISTATAVATRGLAIAPEHGDDDALERIVEYDEALESFASRTHRWMRRRLEPLAGDHRRLNAVADEDAAVSMLKHQRHEIDGHAALLTANLCMP
jgi:hypothetical protein